MTDAAATTDTKKPKKQRHGRCGPGSRPARRSTAHFVEGYVEVSALRRERKRIKHARREEERSVLQSGEIDNRRQKLAEAYNAVLDRTATDEQRKLVRNAEDAKFFAQRYQAGPDAYDRIFGKGFQWPGGLVAGKYYRRPFAARGLRSWEHPYIRRFVASMARAWTGRLRTGDAKDTCVSQFSKLGALDLPYGFVSDQCRDIVRGDSDRDFPSRAHLIAWIEEKTREAGLPASVHMATWIPDDTRPGWIIHPHIWIILPEGHAVWPIYPTDTDEIRKRKEQQQRLLTQVISGLTKAYDCDPGGAAFAFHGKIPTSPLCDYVIIQDTHMPTLGEWAEALDVCYDPELMARRMMAERLKDAGVDHADSNTWWSTVRDLANVAGNVDFKSGGDISNRHTFAKRAAAIITPTAMSELRPSASQRRTVEKLIDTCCRYMAANFDPAKLDLHRRDRGAAAHLMQPGDDVKTKMRRGQTYSAGVVVARTRRHLSQIMITEMKSGREPTIASITRLSGRAYNTVKAHFFACYVTAIASLAVQALVKGVSTSSVHTIDNPITTIPTTSVVSTAMITSMVPSPWQTILGHRGIADRLRRTQASIDLRRRRRSGAMSVTQSSYVVGSHTLEFLSSGPVTIHRSTRRSLAQDGYPAICPESSLNRPIIWPSVTSTISRDGHPA